MSSILQILVNGIIAGSFYALAALGFTLIVRTNRFLFLAHAGVALFGSYLLYAFLSFLDLNFYFALLLTPVLVSGFGYGLYKLIYSPLKKKKASSGSLLLVSLAILFFIENLLLLFFGANVKGLDFSNSDFGLSLNFYGITITPIELFVIFGVFSLFIITGLLVKKTKLGLLLRSVSDNPRLAEIRGVNTDKICSYAFLVGSVLAGFLSIFLALDKSLTPIMVHDLMLKSFVASLVGGLSFLPGAILGGYLLGISENLILWFFPIGLKDLFVYSLMFIFLIFRPKGIFSHKSR